MNPERLHQLRIMRGLSLRDLAGSVGVSAMAVSKWERGEATPTPENRARLAEALGVKQTALIHQPTTVTLSRAHWR